MTSQHILRHQDQPIQIGLRHGYRIEGDHAFVNAELHLPPQASGSDLRLELWATEQPYQGGALTGCKVAEVALDLPTPIGPHVHNVDARSTAHPPLQGRAHAMTLVLLQVDSDGQSSVHSFANYPETQTFIAPHFEGGVGYEIQEQEVTLWTDGIVNPRPDTNLSGSLSIELWAFPVPRSQAAGLRLAMSELAPVAGQARIPAIERRVAFNELPVGQYQLALLLCEWTPAGGYVARDRRDFARLHESAAPEFTGAPSDDAPAATDESVPTPVSSRPSDRLRLVPTAPTPVADEPTKVATAGLVSIQTGTVAQLARVKGLNLKLAKEIIKARPFSSLADLIRVRGIGQKTLARLKGVLTL